jgi:hypothetical protein
MHPQKRRRYYLKKLEALFSFPYDNDDFSKMYLIY